jgi:hypothetical protein
VPVEEEIASADGVRDYQLLEVVLQSKCFERAAGLRKLLQYLWANRQAEVSEYALALEALGRDASFDSRIDATVRVQIGRLRRLLHRYYETEGCLADRRITIPLGSHQMQFVDVQLSGADEAGMQVERSALTVAAVPPMRFVLSGRPGANEDWRTTRLIPLMAAGMMGLLLIIVTGLMVPGVRASLISAAFSHKDAPPLWKQFFDNGKPTRIVLPAPLFFAWTPNDSESLMVRDITINDFDRSQDSPELAEIEKRLGKPGRWQNYTVASDTFASLKLARFLDAYGIQTSFSSSADSPREITDHENIIAFGTVSSLVAYREDLDRLSFKMGLHERYVDDLRLPANSPPPFRAVSEPGERVVAPGIVALLPRGMSGSRILLVQGEQTTALISYLTSDEGMREIGKALQNARTPFFEAVILSEVNEGTPLQSRLAAIRPFYTGAAPTPQNKVLSTVPSLHR